MKLNESKFVATAKYINFALFCAVILLLSACSTVEQIKSNVENRKVAVLTSPTGRTERVISTEPSVLKKAPTIPNIRYSKNTYLCNDESTSENVHLKKEELDFELSFMINSLNNQRPQVNPRGRSFRRLTRNMVTNLYNTPDCEDFRYKLHVINKLLNGSELKTMDN